MRALAHIGDGRLEQQELPGVPMHVAGGLLSVEGSAACISDAETLRGFGPVMETPLVLGHEIVGRVVDVGRDAPAKLRQAIGRRVLLDDNRPCGHCEFCISRRWRFCRSPRYGHIPRDGSPDNWGGYAQTLTLDDRSVLVPVAEDLCLGLATFAMPVGSGVEWLRAAALNGGERVAVLGTSRMAVATVFVAMCYGAGEVAIYGPEEGTQAIRAAEALGARYRGLPNVSDGAFDVIVVVTETPASYLATAVAMAGPLGRVIAASTSREPAPIDPETIRRKGMTIRGGRGASEVSLIEAAELVARERERLSALDSRVVGFDEAERALLELLSPQGAVPGVHLVVTPPGADS
jgi:propanol-preferring alcohol dehydrogenase